MARLKLSNRTLTLSPRVLVGRAGSCQLQLDDPRVSGEHAVLSWDGQGWFVRDLGSRNGTFVDGERAQPGRKVTLAAGITLAFAERRCSLLDALSPNARARNSGGEVAVEGEDGLLPMPSPSDPRWLVYTEQGRWVLEQPDGLRTVRDAETLVLEGQEFVLELPDPLGGSSLASTRAGGPVSADVQGLGLRFKASLDEEFVSIVAELPLTEKTLPPRAFHYMLLTLARARLADADLPESERGWVYVDELCEGLGVDNGRLCVDIYRARKQLAGLGVEDAARTFERRSTSKQIRLGVKRLTVE